MSEFTPGPWRFSRAYRYVGPTFAPVCEIMRDGKEGPKHQANARLIAEAPELFAIVKEAEEVLSHASPDDFALPRLRRVIARIEGRT